MDNRIITGDQNIAACFNYYFATIGSKLAEISPRTAPIPFDLYLLLEMIFASKTSMPLNCPTLLLKLRLKNHQESMV